jgi:hypothetical protein
MGPTRAQWTRRPRLVYRGLAEGREVIALARECGYGKRSADAAVDDARLWASKHGRAWPPCVW